MTDLFWVEGWDMFKSMAILDSSPWPPFGDLVPTHPLKSHLRSQDHRGRMGCKPTYEIGCMPSWARYWDGGVPHPAAWDTNEASLRRRALHTEKGWVGGQSIVSLENLFEITPYRNPLFKPTPSRNSLDGIGGR